MARREIRESKFGGAFVIYVVACVAACGGKASDGTSAPPVAAEALPDALANAFCEGLATCCQSISQVVDLAACEARMRDRINVPTTNPRISYDPNMGAQCVAEVRAVTGGCYEGSADNSTSCEQMLVGLVPLGGACIDDLECAKLSGGNASCTNSVCVATAEELRGTLGQSCSTTCGTDASGTTCMGGTSSDGNAPAGEATCYAEDGLYCDMGVWLCVARGQIDDGCTSQFFGCVDTAQCNMTIGMCEPKSTAGEPCVSSNDCVPTTYCAATGICEQKKNDGESCSLPDECVGYCLTDFAATTGSCASGPVRFVPTESLCQNYGE